MTTHNWGGYNRQPSGRIDPYSGALVSINAEHWVVHAGLAHRAGIKFTSIANAGVKDILIKVPAGVYPHLHKIDVNSGRGNVDLSLYEGATVSADGTALPLVALNRAGAHAAATTMFHTPTVTSPGSLIGSHWLPPTATGVGQSANGMVFSEEGMEWVFSPSTNYLLRITNNSGASISLMISLMLYELNGD